VILPGILCPDWRTRQNAPARRLGPVTRRLDCALCVGGNRLQGMTEIKTITIQNFDRFSKVVAENETAIGALLERIRVIQADPKQHNIAGAKEIASLMQQTLPHSQRVDAAYRSL